MNAVDPVDLLDLLRRVAEIHCKLIAVRLAIADILAGEADAS